MSKITISGNALVVKSSLKLADLKDVKKFRPEALNLMGGEDGKELLFSIFFEDGCGCLGSRGACFSNTTDADGSATITMIVQDFGANKKTFVSENFGGAIVKLNSLEESIPAVLEEIKAQKESVESSITVA